MNGMILYFTYGDIKILNEAIFKYEYYPIYTDNGILLNKDVDRLDEILPLIFCCGVLTGILERIIYPPLKINETALG